MKQEKRRCLRLLFFRPSFNRVFPSAPEPERDVFCLFVFLLCFSPVLSPVRPLGSQRLVSILQTRFGFDLETAQAKKLSQFSLPVIFLSFSGPFLCFPQFLRSYAQLSLVPYPHLRPGSPKEGALKSWRIVRVSKELAPFLFKKPSSERKAFSMAEDFSVYIRRKRHYPKSLATGAGTAGVATLRARLAAP